MKGGHRQRVADIAVFFCAVTIKNFDGVKIIAFALRAGFGGAGFGCGRETIQCGARGV